MITSVPTDKVCICIPINRQPCRDDSLHDLSTKALLFSATFQKRIEYLARNVTTDPIRINVGTTGQANEDITQIVEVLEEDDMKWHWLIRRLTAFSMGKLHVCMIL